MQRGGDGEVAPPHRGVGPTGQAASGARQRAGIADQLDRPRRRSHAAPRSPTRTLPAIGGHPAPPQPLLDRDVWRAKALVAWRSTGAAAACPSVVSSVRPSSSRSSGRGGSGGGGSGPGGAGRSRRRSRRRAPGARRSDAALAGVQVGLAGLVEVERLEPPGRLQQQRGSIAGQYRKRRRAARAADLPGRFAELVQLAGLRLASEPERRLERAGLETRLGRGQRALGSPRRVDR